MKLNLHAISWQIWVLLGLLVIGAVFRFWNFVPGLMFQGDQARDVLIVSSIFRNRDPVFIGPVSSVGNIYLGPLYYYFMLPWLFLSYPSPMGPAIAIAVLSIATILFMYLAGKEFIGKTPALIGAGMFALSSIAVTYGKFSWNPNPAPAVMILVVWATYRAWTKSPWYFVVAALGFSILIQLHYLTLLAAGGIGLIWLLQLREILIAQGNNRKLMTFVMATLLSLVVFISSLTPLILFDFRHDGLNRKAFINLFTEEGIINPTAEQTVTDKLLSIVTGIDGRAQTILYDHLFGKTYWLGLISVVSFVVASLAVLRKNMVRERGLVVLLAFLGTTIVGAALYQHTIFDHYLLFIFPVVFWFWGYWLAALSTHKLGLVVAGLTILSFVGYNATHQTFTPQAWTITDVKRTSAAIYDQLRPNEKYSLVLLGPSKDLYAQNYRYFLSTTDRPPLPPEQAATAETLVVINEDKVASVAAVPIYEIVIFPNLSNPYTFTIPEGPEISIFRR